MTSRLSAELQRLYRLPDDSAAPNDTALRLVGADGRVRAMVFSLRNPADWPVLAAVWRGVQTDFELPAPAIAVNGADAYELWFSLAEPVPMGDAAVFLQGLRLRYLAEVKPNRVQLRPALDGEPLAQATSLIPAAQGETGNWSAFVAPDLAAVFGDEPLLDLPPGEDAQADLLSHIRCIQPSSFEAALGLLQVNAQASAPAPAVPAAGTLGLAMNGRHEDAKRFLLDVMNDPSVPIASRIEAAKALLLC